jgi:chaperonin GroES
MQITPLYDRVLLKRVEPAEEVRGGIIIPDTAKEKPQYAKVVAIGNIENPGISVGDTVFYKKFSGTELEFETKKYLIIPYADLLAKLVETEEI